MQGLDKISIPIEKLFADLENRLMQDIVRRIRKTGEITSTADMQLLKYMELGNSNKQIQREIKRILSLSDGEIEKLYSEVINKYYTQNKRLYMALNKRFTPYEENQDLQSMVKALVKQTRSEFENITRSMGFTIFVGKNKKAFTPLSMYYQKILDDAVINMATGSFSYNTTLRRTIKQMTNSGIRFVPYASGRSNHVVVAVRKAVMTGTRQLFTHLSEMNAAALGTEYFEVTAHTSARPSHQEWQGQVYSKKDLIDICGLGTGEGLCGWNCYHMYLPFVPGVSVRTYTDQQLKDMARKDNETRTWKGEKLKRYEAAQLQRKMETALRKQRQNVTLLKKGKLDKSDIQISQSRYVSALHRYEHYCKYMGLKPDKERIYMDMLGRVA